MTTIFGAAQQPLIGEDTAYLFEAVERSFGVSLGNWQERLHCSVKDLADLIVSGSKTSQNRICLSSATFYAVRAAFIKVHNVPRATVMTGTRLDAILPLSNRRDQWTALDAELGWVLPRLEYPWWVSLFSLILPPSTLIILSHSFSLHLSWSALMVWSIVLFSPCCAFCGLSHVPFRKTAERSATL